MGSPDSACLTLGMNNPDTIMAWHFLEATDKHPQGELRDGQPAPPIGEWLVHDGPIKICKAGLHASENVLDALSYAPGTLLCRVACCEGVVREADKLVCRRRRIEWRVDAEPALRAWARWCALQVVRTWPAPDVVHDWLLTGDERYRADADSAAYLAAYSAADSAARSAAYSAADSAARSAARQAQAHKLVHMIEEARAGRTSWVFTDAGIPAPAKPAP